MPIYEYQCSKCGDVFEAFQKVSDRSLKKCKSCGGGVERLISQSSFQLKGSGWYLTDYAKKSQPAPTDSGTDKKSCAADKCGKKESAPAAKTD